MSVFDDSTKTLDDLYNLDVQFRGTIILAIIQTEGIIDRFIASHFCKSKKKQQEILHNLFYTEKITLESKRQIFVFIIKKYHPEFIVKHPHFLRSLEYIVPLRNVIAHLPLDKAATVYEGVLVFNKYSNGVPNPKRYTDEDMYTISEIRNHLTEGLKDLIS